MVPPEASEGKKQCYAQLDCFYEVAASTSVIDLIVQQDVSRRKSNFRHRFVRCNWDDVTVGRNAPQMQSCPCTPTSGPRGSELAPSSRDAAASSTSGSCDGSRGRSDIPNRHFIPWA